MRKPVKVADLVPGMMVTQVIEQHGPVKIRKVGFIRSADMIRGLTEMGVTLVEVDVDQSLNTELDEESESSTNDTSAPVGLTEAEIKTAEKSAASPTATQRLVASNKQIADVDRQLSQQFHRSLFLPAVDQMPSKWVLYGKPYSLLLGFILLGLCLGIFASYSIVSWMSPDKSPQQVVGIQENEPSTQAQEPKTEQASISPEANKQDALSSETLSAGPVALAKTATQNDAPTSEEVINTTEQSEKKELSEGLPATATEAISSTTSQANSNSEVVNGIRLEEGQKILGYNSGVDDDPEPVIPLESTTSEEDANDQQASRRDAENQNANNQTASTRSSQNTVNPDLLRRIQAAAEDVDQQAKEPPVDLVKVTDLNDLPRIDQLSPAILTQMPAMSFSAHMYASNPRDRWVRVNSQRLGEGDIIANNVILKRIESEKVVLEYQGKEFTMNALSDW